MPEIEIHYFSDDAPRLERTAKGDWIDLRAAADVTLRAGEFALIPLGRVDAPARGLRGAHRAAQLGHLKSGAFCRRTASASWTAATAARTTSGRCRSGPRATP
jgi:hypothetical protein